MGRPTKPADPPCLLNQGAGDSREIEPVPSDMMILKIGPEAVTRIAAHSMNRRQTAPVHIASRTHAGADPRHNGSELLQRFRDSTFLYTFHEIRGIRLGTVRNASINQLSVLRGSIVTLGTIERLQWSMLV
jgi:hypothetical protein